MKCAPQSSSCPLQLAGKCSLDSRGSEGHLQFKRTTLVQNKTTALLFCHDIKEVQGTNTAPKYDSQSIYAVSEAMIRERLIQRVFGILFNVTKGMWDGPDLGMCAQTYDHLYFDQLKL